MALTRRLFRIYAIIIMKIVVILRNSWRKRATTLRKSKPDDPRPAQEVERVRQEVLEDTITQNVLMRGLCGLRNLGNSCFMNSVIQCLSHCEPLVEYFTTGVYLEDLKNSCIQEAQEDVIIAFGDLITNIWAPNNTFISPTTFKLKMGQWFNELLDGMQQDSQEFFLFLINLLHEGLKLPSNEPTTVPILNDSSSDLALENEMRAYYSSNESYIMQHFHGFLRSQISCKECGKASKKFEVFNNLSLPLPVKKELVLKVRYVPFSQSEVITDYLVTLPTKGFIHDLHHKMAELIRIPSELMILAKLRGQRLIKIFSGTDKLSALKNTDTLVLYDVPVHVSNCIRMKSKLIVPIQFWLTSDNIGKYDLGRLFGNPFLIVFPSNEITYEELYRLIIVRMGRYLKDGSFGSGFNESTNSATNYKASTAEVIETMISIKPVKLFIVNNMDFENAKEINEQGLISFEESLGRQTLAVQWTKGTKDLWFWPPPIKDCNDGCHRSSCSIQQCLVAFFAPEKLEAWFCTNCKGNREAKKELRILKSPKVLVLHLKRFEFDFEYQTQTKLDSLVTFPLDNLNIKKCSVLGTDGTEDTVNYNLYGIVNHYGTLYGGHYTATVKVEGQWYMFDDTFVSACKESDVMTEAAYILFYIRK